MSRQVLVIGLGNMGWMMAKRLASVPSSFKVHVFNRNTAIAARHAEQFSTVYESSLPDAVSKSEFVISVLTNSKAVTHVLESLKASNTHSNSLWIDCTSGDPSETVFNAKLAQTMGMKFVDCAVSGGPKGAESGTLMSMVGGEATDVEQAKQVINMFSKDAQHLGTIGAGHAVKAINNTLLAANLLLAGEGLTALKKLGVNMEAAVKAIGGSSGSSVVMTDRIPGYVLNRQFDYGFSLAGLTKDVMIGKNIFESTHIDAPNSLINLTATMIDKAHSELGSQADHTQVVQVHEAAIGVQISHK